VFFFFFSSRRRHTRCLSDWSSDVCSSDLQACVRGSGVPGCSPSGALAPSGPRGRHAPAPCLVPKRGRRFWSRWHGSPPFSIARRSEERRVGKECRCRGWAEDEGKKEEKKS